MADATYACLTDTLHQRAHYIQRSRRQCHARSASASSSARRKDPFEHVRKRAHNDAVDGHGHRFSCRLTPELGVVRRIHRTMPRAECSDTMVQGQTQSTRGESTSFDVVHRERTPHALARLLLRIHGGALKGMTAEVSPLRFLEPKQTEIAGNRCEGMTVRAESGVLGRLQGVIVDPLARRLRYLVVRTSGLSGRSRLVPVSVARIDLDGRTIELLDEDVVRRSQPFRSGLFPPFSDDDVITAIFALRSAT